jgi:hypothetical protein
MKRIKFRKWEMNIEKLMKIVFLIISVTKVVQTNVWRERGDFESQHSNLSNSVAMVKKGLPLL